MSTDATGIIMAATEATFPKRIRSTGLISWKAIKKEIL